jgi:hypothetical protein
MIKLILKQVHILTVAYLHKLNDFLFLRPCDEAACPQKSGILPFTLVHQRWTTFEELTLFIGNVLNGNQLVQFRYLSTKLLRWANVSVFMLI